MAPAAAPFPGGDGATVVSAARQRGRGRVCFLPVLPATGRAFLLCWPIHSRWLFRRPTKSAIMAPVVFAGVIRWRHHASSFRETYFLARRS